MGNHGAGAADANAVQLVLRRVKGRAHAARERCRYEMQLVLRCVKRTGKRGAGAADANAVQFGLRCVKGMASEAQAPRMRMRCECGAQLVLRCVKGMSQRGAGATDALWTKKCNSRRAEMEND